MPPNPTYDLNSSNWFKVYEDYRVWDTDGVVVSGIPDWTALTAAADLLAVLVTSPTGENRWKHGGYLTLGFDTGINDPAAASAESTNSYRLTLKQIKLIEVQKFSPTYSVKLSVPYWFPDIETTIWAYIGAITYPEIELLNQINANTQP